MLEFYLKHTMIAAYMGDDFVSDPMTLLLGIAVTTIVVAIPLFLGFRFLNSDVNTKRLMFGKMAPGETPFLLGLSKGRFAGYVCLVLGLPIFGAGLYPIPDFVSQNTDVLHKIHGVIFFLFIASTVFLDLHLDGKTRK